MHDIPSFAIFRFNFITKLINIICYWFEVFFKTRSPFLRFLIVFINRFNSSLIS